MLDHIESHIHNTFQILTIYVQNFYILSKIEPCQSLKSKFFEKILFRIYFFKTSTNFFFLAKSI